MYDRGFERYLETLPDEDILQEEYEEKEIEADDEERMLRKVWAE